MLRSKRGSHHWFSFVVDTGTRHTVLHTRTARVLGIASDDRVGNATFDTIGHSESGGTVRLSSIIVFGREISDYLVGVVEFQSRVDVAGILGVDFFASTDLLLAFRRGEVVLEW